VATHRIEIARERYKFSCAHMTVFPNGKSERLHGHNYYVSIAIELADVSFERMIDFGLIKDALGELCNQWKEYTLLAARNPYYEVISAGGDELEFRLCGKRYVLPHEDVKVLPIDNVSVEALSSHIAELLVERLGDVLATDVVTGLEVTISENPGQGATCYYPLRG